ncbi:hypothetical protein KA977_15420 [Candidatus Dependentiae bacterium]|nr:hypothetical protein [Candidatus Dependentiae bacterium]
MKKNSIICLCIILIFSFRSSSFDRIEITNYFTNQDEFSGFIKEFGAMTTYHPDLPAESLGLFGWDLNANFKVVNIDENKGYWKNAVNIGGINIPSKYIIIPQLSVTKGFFGNTELSVCYLPIPGSDISAVSGAVKWSFIEGSSVSPAISVRAAYTTLAKTTNFKMDDFNCSISVSKGFAVLTPYVFAGLNHTRISEIEVPNVYIPDKNETMFNYGAGMKINIGVFSIKGYAAFSEIPVYSISSSIGF